MKAFGKFKPKNTKSENSGNLDDNIYKFSKFSNFYLRLFRFLLFIRCLSGIALLFFVKNHSLIIISSLLYIIFLITSLKKNIEYKDKYLYMLIIIDYLVILFLQSLTYNSIFLLTLTIVTASLLGSSWFIILNIIIAAFGVFGVLDIFQHKSFNSDNVLLFLWLILISILLHVISKHQKNIYLTIAKQAYQISLHQMTHTLMVKDINDGILLISNTKKIIDANKAAINILGLTNLTNANLEIDFIYNNTIDKIPKTIFIHSKQAHAHLMPINLHISGLHFELAWLDWIKPYLHTELIANYIQNFLQDSTLIHIEREQKYLKEAQKDKLASMGHMVASIAHEIRNPLATIKNASELILEQIENQDDFHLRLKNILQNNIMRINNIIENILNISKPINVEEKINLNQSIKTIIEEWQEKYDNDKLICNFSLPVLDTFTNFSTSHLQQIIQNLLDNALRFCSKKPNSIQVWLKHHQKYSRLLEIWVLNDGTNVDIEDRSRLFEPFFTKNDNNKGVGLGLHIVRMLCTQNKATIEYAKNIDIPFVAAQYGFVIKIRSLN